MSVRPVTTAFATLCEEARLHGCRVLAHRLVSKSDSMIQIEVLTPRGSIKGTTSWELPTTPERQAQVLLAALGEGGWSWPSPA